MKSQVTLKNTAYLQSQIRERYENTNVGPIEGLEKLDSGMNRIVYEIIGDTYGSQAKGMVLKIQHPDSIENREEVQAWEQHKNTKYEQYLVPVADYSPTYEWLVMPYGESVPEGLVDMDLHEILYDNLAGTDISKDDFVYMEGNASNQRCCDYASINGSI